MKERYFGINIEESIGRINTLLAENDNTYGQFTVFPHKWQEESLKGIYVNAAILYFDLKKTANLFSNHSIATVAKIIRTYISEITAVLKSLPKCKGVVLDGDNIYGVFDASLTSGLDNIFALAVIGKSILEIMNYKLSNQQMPLIGAGIGIDFGKVLMVKTEFKTVQEPVWLGDVIYFAARFSHLANQAEGGSHIFLSRLVYHHLSREYQGFCQLNEPLNCYQSTVTYDPVCQWLQKQG
jgi:class 3 adenylate cyclase